MRAQIIALGGEYEEFAKMLVPKCQAEGFCTEHQCCGMMPRLKDIMKVYQEYKNQKTKQE